jgi:hypothetical protein
MALTTQPQPATYAYSIGLAAAPIVHGQEKAAQTYVKGAFVQDDDAGLITPSASPVDGSGVTKRVIGLATRSATGVTAADAVIVLAGPQVVFEATLSELTAGTHTLAQGDMWKVYPITKGSTNWYLNADAVSDTGGGLVIGFKDAIGTVDGRVYFLVTSTARGGANSGSGVF